MRYNLYSTQYCFTSALLVDACEVVLIYEREGAWWAGRNAYLVVFMISLEEGVFFFYSGNDIRKWHGRYPVGLPHWSFSNLNSYNLTEVPCSAHKQAWEICALKHLNVDKWEQKGDRGREKGSDKPQTQPFRQEEQRNSVVIPAGASKYSCCWVQRPGKDTALWWGKGVQWYAATVSSWVVCIPGRETKSQLCSLPELTSLCPWCQVEEHIICKPMNWYYRITFFPEQRVHSVTIPGSGCSGDPVEV